MEKKLAIELLPLVNDVHDRKALEGYVEYRISRMLQQIETASNMEQVKSIQGAIAELRRFSTLRDEVLQASGKV